MKTLKICVFNLYNKAEEHLHTGSKKFSFCFHLLHKIMCYLNGIIANRKFHSKILSNISSINYDVGVLFHFYLQPSNKWEGSDQSRSKFLFCREVTRTQKYITGGISIFSLITVRIVGCFSYIWVLHHSIRDSWNSHSRLPESQRESLVFLCASWKNTSASF